MKNTPTLNIINLTPHDITILRKTYITMGTERKIKWEPALILQPSGQVLTCMANTEQEALVKTNNPDTSYQVSLTYTTYTPPEDLPEFKPDTIYIVSEVVARLCPERNDFRIVNGLLRGENGKVLGCRSLGRIKPIIEMDTLKRLQRILCSIDNPTEDERLELELSTALHIVENMLQLQTAKG